jgi:Ni/Co efflux regulator RcnB
MRTKFLTTIVAGGFMLGGMAFADPPHHAHGSDLPPGLAKQDKVPPGHAKKMWKEGEHLPQEYRDVRFDDWERYDLRPAPAGYRWVRVDGDAYLTQTTTGLITETILDLLN